LPDVPGSYAAADISFSEAEAAREWGLSLEEWYMKPRWARACMVAQCELRKRLDYWMAKDNG